jgi:ABC-type transport system substrate-binding protein
MSGLTHRDSSYWARTISRRRALAGAAALGAGAVALAACGGSEEGESEGGAGGLVSEPVDSTRQATKGGILQHFLTQDIPDLDPTTSSSSPAQGHAEYQYSRLLKYKAGFMEESKGEVEGDLAEGPPEIFDNGLRLVFKIRPNAGTEPRPPLNGRMMNAHDVAYSYDRFAARNPQAVDLARSISPTAPVERLEVPDDRTLVVRLAEPYAPAIILMASPRHLWVIPREAEDKFNASDQSHGSGPWYLANYIRSSRLEYRRNPNWYDKERPFFDGWDIPIISEAAQQLAQFRAKNIWFGGVRQQEMLPTKRDLPDTRLYEDPAFSGGVHHIMFGFRPGSPFHDERVRQAFSLMQDREIYMDTFFNLDTFRAEGIDIGSRLNSHLGPAWSGIWMDPLGDEFGENSKYFKHDVAEAKRLLSAAGYANGFESHWTYVQNAYGVDWPNRNEVLINMMQEGGLRISRGGVDYQTRYIPDYYRAKGDFDGISTSTGGSRPDPGLWLYVHYHTNGSVAHWKLDGDAEFNRMLLAQMQEFDRNRRIAMIKDIQRYAAKLMPVVPIAGDTAGLQISWPWVGNYGVFRPWPEAAGATEVDVHLWYDKAKHV